MAIVRVLHEPKTWCACSSCCRPNHRLFASLRLYTNHSAPWFAFFSKDICGCGLDWWFVLGEWGDLVRFSLGLEMKTRDWSCILPENRIHSTYSTHSSVPRSPEGISHNVHPPGEFGTYILPTIRASLFFSFNIILVENISERL